uniref:Uncharacterized protein n=1 Tax=mine drainage metagenome TaxID=410659 RepID=E6QUT6_9ZZZZ
MAPNVQIEGRAAFGASRSNAELEALAKRRGRTELFAILSKKSGAGAAIAGKIKVLKTLSSAHNEYYTTRWITATLASGAARIDT